MKVIPTTCRAYYAFIMLIMNLTCPIKPLYLFKTKESFSCKWIEYEIQEVQESRQASLRLLIEHLNSPRVFSGVRVTRSLVLCVCFVDRCLSFFFLPLCCLSIFDLRILIAPLVSSNSSYIKYQLLCIRNIICISLQNKKLPSARLLKVFHLETLCVLSSAIFFDIF